MNAANYPNYPKEQRPLYGVRVVDFSRVLAGPYLTQILVDLGADVIKIEQPGRGADERHLAPFKGSQSGYFMMLNRGKRSVTLNLAREEGVEIARGLIRKADIVVENFQPGVMDRLGLGYTQLKELNPRIIMCSISAFGQEGPYARRAGYDIVGQAMSGLMWMTGYEDGPPMRSGTSIGDVMAAAHAGYAICAVLYERERTGVGRHIDICLRDSLSAVLETAIIRYTLSDGQDVPMRSGNHHATMAPYGVFDAGRGRYVVLGALNDSLWERLCKAIGREDMIADERYNSSTQRAKNLSGVIEAFEGWLRKFEQLEIPLKILEDYGVPCAPVLSIPELLRDEQFLMRNMLVEVEDPVVGRVKLPGTPIVFPGTTYAPLPLPPPMLGEHTEEVLSELLGMTGEEIGELRSAGVI